MLATRCGGIRHGHPRELGAKEGHWPGWIRTTTTGSKDLRTEGRKNRNIPARRAFRNEATGTKGPPKPVEPVANVHVNIHVELARPAGTEVQFRAN